MDVIIEKKGEYALVCIKNDRLDSFLAPELKSQIVMAIESNDNIILDLSQCSYCDSSGLSAILFANRQIEGANGTFILCGLNPPVEKLIKLAMLDSILTIVANVSDADQLLQNKAELS